MRRLRPGLIDICAAVLVLFVLILPDRDLNVATAYRHVEPEQLDQVISSLARAQARTVTHPADGAAAEELAELLSTREVRQHDQALRVAGQAAKHEDSPTRWRALSAISLVHAARIEIPEAYEYGVEAIEACEARTSDCAAHERTRLDLYVEQLRAGLEAIRGGTNPQHDPDAFREQIGRVHPTTTFRGGSR